MQKNDSPYLLSSYDFELPEELIAQSPPQQRGESRLMVLPALSAPDAGLHLGTHLGTHAEGYAESHAQAYLTTHSEPSLASQLVNASNLAPKHYMFKDLPNLLPPNSLLVANNVQVVPARLHGRLESGGKTELLLLTPLPKLEISPEYPEHPAPAQLHLEHSKLQPLNNLEMDTENWYGAEIQALARPARRFVPGSKFWFGEDIVFYPKTQGEFGQVQGRLTWKGNLQTALFKNGEMPLPPYIRRPQTTEDAKRYQTIFANSQKAGAVAAPTAGLHFTKELKQTLLKAGHSWHELTLYVGYGTFSPVRAADIRQHKMHTEWLDIPASTVNAVLEAKKMGRPIVAVGTTSARALEGTAGRLLAGQDFIGATDIFIYPGYEFKVVDKLITNFHLPHSSLLLLVSALAGQKRLLAAYEEAVREKYRFFSYGDAMLV